jgi:ATP phosphoribosyltransferase regulatory subunit
MAMATENERWLLPEGIEELLPPQAERLETVRRDLLDLYRTWGYELVITPFIEYLESLLTGTGSDLDLQTFKLTDQMTGRTMGIRADITPQAARIDAHQLCRESPTRLCYIGTVLHTRTDGLAGSRSPLQIGAELYGHSGPESDVEILRLMLETLGRTGVGDVYLDLGHVGIFRGLAHRAGLDARQEAALFDALQRKAVPEIEALLDALAVDDTIIRMFGTLPELSGDEVLERADRVLADAGDEVKLALANLRDVAELVRSALPNVPLHFDLSELRGYHYHSGVVFAAFVPGRGREIAVGGRYDRIGEVFGRARPATGFSADLRTLLQLGSPSPSAREPNRGGYLAPWSDEPSLKALIADLRAAGHRVICVLPGQQAGAREMGCDHVIEWENDRWITRQA